MTETIAYIPANFTPSVRLDGQRLTFTVDSGVEFHFEFGDERAKELAALFAEAGQLLRERHEAVYGAIIRRQEERLRNAGWFRRSEDTWVHDRYPKASFTFAQARIEQLGFDEPIA